MTDEVDDATAVLLGLACGDALGRPVEFTDAATIRERHGRVTEMLGQGSHGKPAGTVTDDTEMALCLARSLVETGGFDPADVADRFAAWYEAGPFDIGLLTMDVLDELRRGASWREAGPRVHAARPEGSNAGNGSVMRCVPHALAFGDDPETLVAVSRCSSAITHADDRCTWGCAVLNLAVADLLRGGTTPLETALGQVGEAAPQELRDALAVVPDGLAADDLRPTGYVVHTLQIAFYHALTADSAEEAVVAAVTHGGDADTTAAVTGALAGARFGAGSLPDRWVDQLRVDGGTENLASELRSLGRALVTQEFDVADDALD